MNHKTIVEVDGETVFTTEWIMWQLQALMEINNAMRRSIVRCAIFTAISLLLSLVALVITVAL